MNPRAMRLRLWWHLPIHQDELATVMAALDREQARMPIGMPRIIVSKVLGRWDDIISGARAAGGASKSGT